jgi:hypothetical protein
MPDNDYSILLPELPFNYPAVTWACNTYHFKTTFSKLDVVFKFHEPEKAIKQNVSSGGLMLAFKSEIKQKIFPTEDALLEFIPFKVAGEDWFFLNCLKSIVRFDEQSSQLFKSQPSNQIYLIMKLHAHKALPINERHIFTLEGSNKATIFVSEKFKQECISHEVKGLAFREIGTINDIV